MDLAAQVEQVSNHSPKGSGPKGPLFSDPHPVPAVENPSNLNVLCVPMCTVYVSIAILHMGTFNLIVQFCPYSSAIYKIKNTLLVM
jgi:hypothetical protein